MTDDGIVDAELVDDQEDEEEGCGVSVDEHTTAAAVKLGLSDPVPFFELLDAAITVRGWTGADLRERLAGPDEDPDKFKGAVSSWRRGIVKPTGARIVKLCEIFGWDHDAVIILRNATARREAPWTGQNSARARQTRGELTVSEAKDRHLQLDADAGQSPAGAVPMETAGRLIWRERRRKGLTQTQLADRTGVGTNTVSRVETGKSLDPATVRALAEGLGIGFDEFRIYGFDLAEGIYIAPEDGGRAALVARDRVRGELAASGVPVARPTPVVRGEGRRTKRQQAIDAYLRRLRRAHQVLLAEVTAAQADVLEALPVDHRPDPAVITRAMVEGQINVDRGMAALSQLFITDPVTIEGP